LIESQPLPSPWEKEFREKLLIGGLLTVPKSGVSPKGGAPKRGF